MKRYLLSYNCITKQYNLDYGCFNRNREVLGNVNPEQLTKKLIEMLPLHKKIMLYGEEKLEGSIKEIFSKSFKSTGVKIQFVKDLSNLC